MPKAPTCVNCVHYQFFRYPMPGFDMQRCNRRKRWSPVQGEVARDRSAHQERRSPGLIFGKDRCGPDARYFVQAPEPVTPGAKPVRPKR